MFIVIFSTAIMTKLYVIFSSWLGTSLGNAGLSANGVAKMIVLVGGSIAVIDGPNIIERILGIDAGLKNGWSAVMAGYGLSKGAVNGLSSLSEGVKGLAKTTTLGASMGAGALSGMFGKDKNSNIVNDDDNTDKNNNDKNNLSNNDIEQDMKNSDSNKNENPNVADNNKGINTNKDNLGAIAQKSGLNNEISDNKGINTNKDNLGAIAQKSGLNNEISDNKGINTNKDNLGAIAQKSGLNIK